MDNLNFRQTFVVITLWGLGLFTAILGVLRHEDWLLMAIGLCVFSMGSVAGLIAETGNEKRKLK